MKPQTLEILIQIIKDKLANMDLTVGQFGEKEYLTKRLEELENGQRLQESNKSN